MMEKYKSKEDLRNLYIDMLIEWKMYDEAIVLMDISGEKGGSLGIIAERPSKCWI